MSESASKLNLAKAASLGVGAALLTSLCLFDVEQVSAVASTAVLFGLPSLFIAVFWRMGPGRNAARVRALRTLNLHWYRTQNPQAVKPGSLACKHCGSHHIYSRIVIRGVGIREHYCQRCGEPLYYSEAPE